MVTRAGRRLLLAVLICLAAAQGCTAPAPLRAAPTVENPTADNPMVDNPTADNPEVNNDDNDVGELRDGAVASAEQAAIMLASLDHRDPQAGYDRLLELLTEPARQEWEQRRGEYLAPIMASGAVTSAAMVQASGVAALDPAAGTATVLVAATATVSSTAAASTAAVAAVEQPAPPMKRHYRLRMSVIRTPAGWKVAQLQILQ